MNEGGTVSDLGEFGVIERIRRFLPPAPDGELWSGDDAAVLARPNGSVVISTDVLVEDVDFAEWASGVDVGWKAMAANASDLAAMGARPWRAVATLALPPETTIAFVDELTEGLVEGAAHHELSLVGGDISSATEIVLGVTVLGVLDGPGVTRSRARNGDDIYVTGTLGGARAGLEVLEGTLEAAEARDALVARQLRPEARIDEGETLRRAGATAMIDVSDGLIADLVHVLDASGGLGCSIDPSSIPVAPGVPDLSYVLYGGEDFELLFTLPPGQEAAVQSLGATRIGRTARGGRSLGDTDFELYRRERMGSPARPVSDLPRALTIAGSDSGGGAGIQADLKVFLALGCHGMSAITALTAQNTVAVTGIHAVPPDFVIQQIEAVTSDIGVDAAKTGMLASADIVSAVAKAIETYALPNVVVDPVFVSKHRDELLARDAVTALREELFPRAAIVTPNLFEAGALLGREIDTLDDMRSAAEELAAFGPGAVLVKGGHLSGESAIDVLWIDGRTVEIVGPRYDTQDTHGTGCTLSAAIAAFLARGQYLEVAVREAKTFVGGAIERGIRIGKGYGPVNPGWALPAQDR